MALQRLLEDGRSLLARLRPASPRQARRAATVVPVIACLPGSDLWFLRFALAFLAHLDQGGSIVNRLSGRVVGPATGRPFNFDHMRGGPLLWAPGFSPSGHLFIGHTICPGFNKIAARFPWWRGTRFCAPGYDYFREGLNYAQVPVDMAPHAYSHVSVNRLDAAAWVNPAQRSVLLYSDPLEQAGGYFNHCRSHPMAAYNRLGDRPLADWKFRDYLFQHALPSYAKIFASYQVMASQVPGSVSLVPHWQIRERPARTLASVLSHLTAASRDWPMIGDAVDLARRDHLAAVERELGRPLDGTRRRRGRSSPAIPDDLLREQTDPGLRREAVEFLASLGIDSRYFTLLCADSADPRAKIVA